MKISDFTVFVVGNPPPGWGGRYFIFVKLTTDDNISGIGEVYCATFGPKAMTAMIEDVFARYVEGSDPFGQPHGVGGAVAVRERKDGTATRGHAYPAGLDCPNSASSLDAYP